MRRNRIQEKWNEFARLCLPKDAPAIQHQEMRRAFYAGVEGLFKLIIHDLTPGTEVEEADLQMLDEMQAELKDFSDSIKAGAA